MSALQVIARARPGPAWHAGAAMVLEMLSQDGARPAPRVVSLFALYMVSSALMVRAAC